MRRRLISVNAVVDSVSGNGARVFLLDSTGAADPDFPDAAWLPAWPGAAADDTITLTVESTPTTKGKR